MHVKIGSDVYDEIPQEAVAASGALVWAYERLGRPQTPFSKSGTKLMDIIIAIWQDLYPLDAKIWYDQRKEYQQAEKSISDQVKTRSGRSLASYPMPIYQMMKKVFTGFDAAERKNCIKMVKKWPMFRFANKV